MRRFVAVSFLAFLISSNLGGQISPPPANRPGQINPPPANRGGARGGQIAQPPANRGQAAVETGIYLVTFRRETPAAERASVVQGTGARIRVRFDAANSASVVVPDAAALARLRNHPGVLSVFENRPIRLFVEQGGDPTIKPKAPTNLNATAISSSQISLAWADNSNNETGFAIERCRGLRCGNFAEISRVGPNVTSFSDSGLTAETLYRYRARAFNAAGTSKYSNIDRATTQAAPPPPPPPPAAPGNLTSSAVSHSQVNLNWSDNSVNEDGFRLERCTGPLATCSNFTQIAQLAANVTSYSDPGLQAQSTYTYRVRSYNTNGSSVSNSSEATTPAAPPPPPPAAPSNLTSSAVSHSQVNLNWSDNSGDEDGFQLERCTGPLATCTNFSQIVQLAANVSSFSDPGLQAQITYTYRVRAFNANGSSVYSNSSETTTTAAPPPPPPAAPGNLNASAVSHSQVNLNWSDNSGDEDGFRLERCTGPLATCSNFTQIAQLAANVISYSDLGLQAQITYTYRVRAFNANGSSVYSNSSETTTTAAPPPPPPAAPGNLNASAISHSQVNLNWTDNSGDEDGFRLERCTGPLATCSNFTQIAQLAANVISYSDLGLQAQTTYTYRVRAFNANGSSVSNSSEATTTAAPPPPPPAAPGNLNASAISHSQVNLNWTDNSGDEDGFRLERCTGPLATCSNFTQIAQLAANVISYSDLGLQAQTTYTYRVRAFNANGSSVFSNSSAATTSAAPPSTQVVPSGVQRIGAAPGATNWTGAGIGVAVVDTGLDFSHPDLGLATEIPGVNAFNAFGGTCQDIHGHGTHVAGIVGARNNTIDVVGVAPNATIYCVNVFQPDPVEGVVATDESLLAGLQWIATHANTLSPPIRVVNMSLGRDKTPQDDNPNHPVRLAVKALYDSGITVVVAAGNDPLRLVTQQVPAGYPEVIAVASTTARNGVNGYDSTFPACVGLQSIKADTASYFTTDGAFLGGTGVTVSAPGEQQEDMFDFLGSCFLEPIGILSTAMGGGTVELSGTSMASPHVAGVVALMWERERSIGLSLAPEFARTRIRDTAVRRGTAPLDSPLAEYTFDGEREGVIWAPAAVGDVPPPPQDMPPTVSILSPATGSSFSAGASITFQGTANDSEDGNIAASLVWTSSRDGQIGTGGGFSRTLSSGNHVITASVGDSGGNLASANVSISVGSASTPTRVQVSSVTYALQGTTLLYTVRLVNEFGGPVAGATVTTALTEFIFTGDTWIRTGTTNSQGVVQFQLLNADFGCYVTAVENVVAAGLTWIPGTPENYFCQ